jgi:hypothetical protein
MDTLCEQSLFSNSRRVGNNGRVHVYPYKRILHCPVQYEGLKLKELQWDMHESIKPNSIAVVIEPQKLEDVQISWTPEGTQHGEEFDDEVDSSSNESDTDRSIAETRNSSDNYEDEQPVQNRPVSSLPEGMGNARFSSYKIKRYKCLYCSQVGRFPGCRTLQRAMSHRAHCDHNPNRDQHYKEFRSKTSSRQINHPRGHPAAQKSKSSAKYWVIVDGSKYGCRDCLDRGDASKVWECKLSVVAHYAKCKYRIAAAKTKPTFVDNNEIQHYEEFRSKTSSRQINHPRGHPAAQKSESSAKYWVAVDGSKYGCRDCLDRGDASKVWECKVSVIAHYAKCKYRIAAAEATPTFVDDNEIQHYEEFRSKTSSRQINHPPGHPAAQKSKSSAKYWVVVDGSKYGCRDCLDRGDASKVWECKLSVTAHYAKCNYRIAAATKTKPTFVDNNEISDNSGRTDRSQDAPNRINPGQH